jgi:hypothetical protein
VNLLWTILATLAIAAFGTGFCYWLIHKAQEVQSTLWILKHIVCPMLNILVLLILVSRVYPLVYPGINSLEFWEMLNQQGRTTDLLNILFFVGLLLAWFVTRESSIYLSRRLDHKFAIEGSIRLVADAVYLVLQIPVMLIYYSFLKLQRRG